MNNPRNNPPSGGKEESIMMDSGTRSALAEEARASFKEGRHTHSVRANLIERGATKSQAASIIKSVRGVRRNRPARHRRRLAEQSGIN